MKNIKKVIILLVVLIVLLPLVLNLTMFIPVSISKLTISQETWLMFWGSYLGGAIGGVGTLIAVYFTIKYYERQSKQTTMLVINSNLVTKLGIIQEKIYDREPIPDSLYKQCQLSSEVLTLINEYNKLQGSLLSYFTDAAFNIFISLLFIHDEDGNDLRNNLSNYFKIPQEVKDFSYVVGKYSLYENCSELIKGDPQFAHMLEKEAGGSYGMWHQLMHNINDDFRQQELKRFFQLVHIVIELLEDKKVSLQKLS